MTTYDDTVHGPVLEAYMYETNQAKLLRWLIRNGSEEIQLEIAAAARGILEG